MATYRFETVKTHRAVRGKCPNCGKTVTRSQTFEHTVNPFNKNDAGDVKSYEEVSGDVRAEADSWVPDFTHCEAGA